MQLVAYGAQDIYLTGNPQITFFKVVYRRHTNFSMEAIAQTWSGSATSASGKATATISRNGDLIYRMYLEIKGKPVDLQQGTTGSAIAPAAQAAHNIPANAITSVELEIGGQKIDKHTGKWMEVWAELTQPNDAALTGHCGPAATTNVNGGTLFQQTTGMGGAQSIADAAAQTFFVPLQFWFCRNVGLALPLIALQYHEVKVILDHTLANARHYTDPSNTLWVDYIYLDTDERRRFAQVSHEYLIEQVQEESWSSSERTLNFNHPVKELIWARNFNPIAAASTRSALMVDGTLPSLDVSDTWQLKLNGHDRFAAQNTTYFTRVQVLEHHTGPGGIRMKDSTTFATGATLSCVGSLSDSIAVYSFALKPEEHQPSGTCNFSRIDNAVLDSEADESDITVYAVNYNVLRIMSGMGGLAYSN